MALVKCLFNTYIQFPDGESEVPVSGNSGGIPLPCRGSKSSPCQVSRADRWLGDEQTPRGRLNILLLLCLQTCACSKVSHSLGRWLLIQKPSSRGKFPEPQQCVSLSFASQLGEESIKKRSGHPKSVNPSSEMTAVGLYSCFTATLSKLVKVAVASGSGLWRVMIFHCIKLLKGPHHLAPSGEPSLLQYREIYPLWPTVKLPLKPLLIQIWFSSGWLQSQWGKRLRYDKLATCIFYVLLEKSWVFYTRVLLLFVGRDVLWDPSVPHFRFFLLFKPQSLSAQ